ncbi:MAG: T9SS type A sorting domain-containing protein [Bacteroidia bacterium]|nr:T9SS type A sorting domain-containing protein [Bacteroidia bacterium]
MKNLIFKIVCFVALTTSINLHSQSLISGTRFFKILYSIQAPPHDKYASTDSIHILWTTMDSAVFTLQESLPVRNQDTFFKAKNKIFLINGQDSFLRYDYSLVSGDTFNYIDSRGNKNFIVDSVINTVLQDGKTYKHWYLHVNNEPSIKLIWVELLGEKTYGWSYPDPATMDYGGVVKAICANDELIYWDITDDLVGTTTPGCDFVEYEQYVSVEKVNTLTQLIYPNPVTDIIYTENMSGNFQIFNAYGQIVVSGKLENSIKVDTLQEGIYFLQVGEKIIRIVKL